MPRLGSIANGIHIEPGPERTLYIDMASTRPGGKTAHTELRVTNRDARKLATMLLKAADLSDKDEDHVEAMNPPSKVAPKKRPAAR